MTSIPPNVSTWEDRVKVDDFNCVFLGWKAGPPHNKLGEFLTSAYLCLGSKLFGVQTVSALICSRNMLLRCRLAHDTSIFVHDS